MDEFGDGLEGEDAGNAENPDGVVGVNRIEIGLDSDADADARFDAELKKKKKGCVIF